MASTKNNREFQGFLMIMNLRNIEFLMSILTMLVAYIITETSCGFLRAWVAKMMGDDSAERNGFLSLNPLVHIDFIGVIFLVLYNFGWGRYIPINPYSIHGPFQYLKITLAYFSDTIARIILAIVALVILVSSFGIKLLEVVKPMIFHQHIALPILAKYYPETSSFILTIAIILAAIIYLCVLLAVLNLIVNTVRLVILFYFQESLGSGYLEFFIPILLIIFLADPLQHKAIDFVILIAYYLTRLWGGSFI